MLKRIWARIATRIRPDRADLSPLISFDSSSGHLSVELRAVIRGRCIGLSNAALASGDGNLGHRRFRIPHDQIESVRELRDRFDNSARIRCAAFDVPNLAPNLSRLLGFQRAEISPEASELIASAVEPRKAELRGSIGFKEAEGALTVGLTLSDASGRITPFDLRAKDRPILRGHQFFRLDDQNAALANRLAKSGVSGDDGLIEIRGTSVPEALKLLRETGRFEQSSSAGNLSIHEKPLERRTYLELADPETLIVKENLTSEAGEHFVVRDIASGEWPDWIRSGKDYFRTPARSPKGNISSLARNGRSTLRGDQIAQFLADELPAIKRSSRVFVDRGAENLKVVSASPQLHTNLEMDPQTNHIVIEPKYRTGSDTISHRTLRNYDRARGYFRNGATFHKVDWKLVEQVQRAAKELGFTERPDGSFTAQALSLEEIINYFSKLGILAQTEVLDRFRKRLLDFSRIEPTALPNDLRRDIKIRSYQQAGYDWLNFTKNYGLPGILADEMGLGKTLQTLLAVAHFKEKFGPCPSLVVCPASLISKWVDEAGKFFHTMIAVPHSGGRRLDQLRRNLSHADLVVTNYDLLRQDKDLLSQTKWRFLIADEAQRIKNNSTQRAQAIRAIPAEARIAITGTPVENSLLDLWSLFDFLAPGFLGKKPEFDRAYNIPISKQADINAAKNLNRRIRPFMLRRLKQQVASELPDKTVKALSCELTPSQRQLYQAILDHDLNKAINATGGAKLTLGNPHIFAVLTKLKQVCCHPGLITKDFQDFKAGVSGKFDVFTELVGEMLEDGQSGSNNKFVGFSQYQPMAAGLCDYIVKHRRQQCKLIDGSVPPGDRHRLCKSFCNDASQFGMMMTLGAGGVGLDLQAANYVLLYGRWWNPAVEDQAIDRVHRLGQKRQVIVLTITTKGTLEEKIENRQDGKRRLAGHVIVADEVMRKEVSREELMDLVRLN